jgi:hypothetical protein
VELLSFATISSSHCITSNESCNEHSNTSSCSPYVAQPPIAPGHGGDYGLIVQGGASLSPSYLGVISLPDGFCL